MSDFSSAVLDRKKDRSLSHGKVRVPVHALLYVMRSLACHRSPWTKHKLSYPLAISRASHTSNATKINFKPGPTRPGLIRARSSTKLENNSITLFQIFKTTALSPSSRVRLNLQRVFCRQLENVRVVSLAICQLLFSCFPILFVCTIAVIKGVTRL